jgi:tetratricopeptide (TPR) repeat protein
LRLAPESLSLNLSAMLRAADMATAERFAAVVQRLAPEKGAWALMGVAIMYRRFGKEPEAIAALERYEMLANAHGAGDADWGQYYLMRGNFDAAHEKFESAVVKYEGGRADPGYAPVQLFMANAATAQAPQPLAEERFQDLLRRLRAVTQQ